MVETPFGADAAAGAYGVLRLRGCFAFAKQSLRSGRQGYGGFQQAEQHFLDAAGARGLELLSDSGLQGCVADFDDHGSLLVQGYWKEWGESTKTPEGWDRGIPLLAKDCSVP